MNHYDTTDSQFPLASNEIRLLAELGFMAAASGQLAIATEIFDSLIYLRPKKAFPYVGKSIAFLYVGLIAAAVGLLSAASQVVETDQEQIWIYLALAFQRMGDLAKARKILDFLLDSGELSKVDEIFARSILNGNSGADEGLPKPFPVAEMDTIHSLSLAS